FPTRRSSDLRQPFARNDDRILRQLPSGRFLLPRKELQARRLVRREVLFLLLRDDDRRVRAAIAANVASEGEKDQRESDSRNATVTRTPAPVAPRASREFSCSAYAVPAMSRCAHEGQSTNSFKKSAAVVAPPHRPPEFFMSAHSLRISSL